MRRTWPYAARRAFTTLLEGPQIFMAAFDLCDRALHIDNSNVFALTGMTLRYIVPVIEAQSNDPQADIRRADELVTRALSPST